jgi:hypothetical protein
MVFKFSTSFLKKTSSYFHQTDIVNELFSFKALTRSNKSTNISLGLYIKVRKLKASAKI